MELYVVYYRCGLCGDIVAKEGSLVNFRAKENTIKAIQNRDNAIKTVAISGVCCPDKKSILGTDLESQRRFQKK